MNKEQIQKVREILEYYCGFHGKDEDVISVVEEIQKVLTPNENKT